MNYVIYYRDPLKNTSRTLASLSEQRQRVDIFLASHPGEVIACFSEIESSRIKTRVQLLSALQTSSTREATLVIPHLGLLNRNVDFLVLLKNFAISFFALDYPEINPSNISLLTSIALHAREVISSQTRAKLQELKAQGAKLGAALVGSNFTDEGRRKSAQVRRAVSMVLTGPARSFAIDLRKKGSPLKDIAKQLNTLGFKATRGGQWGPKQVARLLEGAQ